MKFSPLSCELTEEKSMLSVLGWISRNLSQLLSGIKKCMETSVHLKISYLN